MLLLPIASGDRDTRTTLLAARTGSRAHVHVKSARDSLIAIYAGRQKLTICRGELVGGVVQKRRAEYPPSYNLQRLSVRPGMECIPGTDTETESAS